MTKPIKLNTRFYRLFPSTGYLGYGYEEYEAEYGRSALLVIDVQQRLLPAIAEAGRITWNCRRLLDGAKVLGVTSAITERR